MSPAHTVTLALSSQNSDPTSLRAHSVRAYASYVSPLFSLDSVVERVTNPPRCSTPRAFKPLVFLHYLRVLVSTRPRTMPVCMKLHAYTYTIKKSSKTPASALSVSVRSAPRTVSIGCTTGVHFQLYCLLARCACPLRDFDIQRAIFINRIIYRAVRTKHHLSRQRLDTAQAILFCNGL